MDGPQQTGGGAKPWGDAETPYDQLGGEARVRELADAFYDRVARDPIMAAMHPDDLTESRQKFFEFLSGWLGGPPLYMQRRGHPRLRMRHMPFPIDEAAVGAWLACMRGAMEAVGIDERLARFLDERFEHTAHFMQNRA